MNSSFKINQKKITAVAAILVAAGLVFPAHSVFSSGDSSDAQEFYVKMYDNALRDLQFGNASEKISAARLMGSHKLSQFIRPLGDELLKDIDHPQLRKTTTNDAYIKSTIAWAIGRIGHRWSYPYLIEALDKTLAVVDTDIKSAEAKAEKAKNESSPAVMLVPNRPTPALMNEGFKYPASPDYNWSVADDLKSSVGNDPRDESYQMKLLGYNRVNQAIHIIDALGDIGRQNGIYFRSLTPTNETVKILDSLYPVLQKQSEHPLSDIRGASALALGGLGTKKALEILQARFNVEADYRVKVKIARSILVNDKSQHSYFDFLVNMLPNNDVHVRRESALALKELSMGEAVFAIGDAIKVEENEIVRRILLEAEFNARMDNILPVNY
jgi:HEAT repeat protein